MELGSLHYLKMSMSAYEWRQGRRVLEALSTIEEKPVAIMQDNGDGTYEVAVKFDGHVMWSTVNERDLV